MFVVEVKIEVTIGVEFDVEIEADVVKDVEEIVAVVELVAVVVLWIVVDVETFGCVALVVTMERHSFTLMAPAEVDHVPAGQLRHADDVNAAATEE